MNIRFLAAGFILALAACSSGTDDFAGSKADRQASPQSISTRTPVAIQGRGFSPSFASLPDRGDLVAYLPSPPRREGPSTWHPISVSEAHALGAAVTGTLRMTTPDGQVVDYRYQRHVEHPNGNWSWVGQLSGIPGGQAILTFGERAAFGTFRRPGAQPLQLTMRDGMAWIVERDPRAMRGVDADEGPDYLVAPASMRAAGAQTSRVTASATASAGPVVDLVVGYTSGFAAKLGGQSQAVTRLTHLVTLTNEAYASSQLNAQVRLVRTLQVSYPDATDNNTALSELTGSNGRSSVSIPASLVPLRQARDQYGGDLVSLVRKFSDPENDGCGVAWMIGGGGTSFTTSDAPWGYSVVSDGSDDGFFCREETLAHELGHNMGQSHNVEDSDGDPGAHPYSYGYRESAASGFFTIMAYRLGDTQTAIPYFANPNVAFNGRPTGIANSSDNVRSMAQTIPIVATFRTAVVPLGMPDRDFNRDGRSDILWRNGSDGRNTAWLSGNSATQQALASVSSQAWKVAGTGDFNGDSRSDILWRSSGDGRNAIWLSGNSATQQAVATVGDQRWKIVGTGDFNGDGRSDILWRNSGDGRNAIWLSGNSATQQSLTTVGDQGWKIVGTGDFNSDGRSDVLWRNSSNGRNTIWLSGSAATQQAVATVQDQGWKVAGTGDFNGDGRWDILWRNSTDGRNAIWHSGNSATQAAMTAVSDQTWRIAGTGDFNGDGRSDILWRNSKDGRNAIWLSGSSGSQQAVATVSSPAWVVVG